MDLTGAITATTLGVMVEATRGALEAEAVISPDEPDPIDMARLIDL